jgi:hypothetical protein
MLAGEAVERLEVKQLELEVELAQGRVLLGMVRHRAETHLLQTEALEEEALLVVVGLTLGVVGQVG